MVGRVELPPSLAVLSPGPELAAALASIDLGRVANDEIVEVLQAQARQAAHEQARLLTVIAEVGRCGPGAGRGGVVRLERPSPFAPDEVRAALAWSRRAAEHHCTLAEQVV
ncbi:MAG TPA: hypothetical protein VD813_01915, partial [Pseudonocardia sp.]|nr:hypothetical protein [Pseudonocardia sp.]